MRKRWLAALFRLMRYISSRRRTIGGAGLAARLGGDPGAPFARAGGRKSRVGRSFGGGRTAALTLPRRGIFWRPYRLWGSIEIEAGRSLPTKIGRRMCD